MSDKYAALKQAAESNINILENIAGYAPEDIDGDTVELRFEDENGCDTGCDVSIVAQCQSAADVMKLLLAERDADKRRIAELEAREVKLPPLSDDLIAILGRPNFTCAHLAELMRKGGDDIRRKAEHEQAAVIYWFLSLYLEHGNKWEAVAKADIQSRVAMASASLKIEGE
ncbi:hypothetical protein EV102420_06_00210 [Pseudescherichia vulneris NBRC 102420]|uniref:Ead/Ea22-like family protein n=1 Tax=Pseudescherichia vulneris NBRC 102420 TaxID=1115515 RepID=A0A090VPW8_PSEVU|nr:hypothetical protein [Pseudescherichia vulneris]GAL57147.1 hypothetical protein EV102420_06_00210 [Pseudescherichia vulneris NBRC 102420]STQ61002.1 Uncharacterised protein [Pseudescherichia vulneris]